MDHFLYSHDLKMIQGWYCKEKLDAGHSWGSKGFYKMVQKTFLDMFPEVNSFPWGNCELQRTDNICGCKYLSMFSAKWRLLCLLFFKHLFRCVEQNVYKLLLVWNESWLLRATFCMNKNGRKEKQTENLPSRGINPEPFHLREEPLVPSLQSVTVVGNSL